MTTQTLKKPLPKSNQELLLDKKADLIATDYLLLDKKTTELEEKERDLNAQLAKNKDLELKITKNTFNLAELEKNREDLENKVARLSAVLESKQEEINIQAKKQVELANLAKEEQRNLANDKKVLKQALDSLKSEIEERKEYQKTQEQLIQDSIQEGNESLKGLQEEYRKYLIKKDETLNDIGDIEAQKDELNKEISSLSLQKRNLEEVYNKTSENYKTTLSSLRIEVDKLTDTYKNMKSQIDAWALKMETENRELETKRKVLETQTEKLREEQRYIESRQRLI